MLKSMNDILNTTFETSSSDTEQFIQALLNLKKDLNKLFTKAGVRKAMYHKGHFEVSIFIENKNYKVFYLHFSDFRFFKGQGYIRTCEHFKDYTGGPNWSLNMDENFEEKLLKFIA